MSQQYQRVSSNVLGVDVCKKCSGRLVRDITGDTHDERRCMNCGRVTYIRSSVGKVRRNPNSLLAVVKQGKKTQKKEKVRALVSKYGVNATADMMEMPRSTVGLWSKGLSNKPRWAFNRSKYSKKFKTEVAEYAIRNKNNYYTAKKCQIPRGSVQNWVREYKDHKGEGWLSK